MTSRSAQLADLPPSPTFADFFESVHGRGPLPWQAALARRVAVDGWPSGLAIPTGLGKTSALDVAVWALAAEADIDPVARIHPTRVWYVVNRRLLVDAAYDHARNLRDLLAGAQDGPLAAMAARLVQRARLGSRGGRREPDPLQVSRLRGGTELGARPPDPSQPALVFATVPMFASRWLFRGYGSTRSMRPVDAAHAGIDSLILLDEAHLARHLDALAEATAACDVGDPSRVVPTGRSGPRFVAMTATGDGRENQLGLTESDHAHPIVVQRLTAAKPTRLVQTTKARLARALAEQAAALLAEAPPAGRTCVVFVNTAGLAGDVVAAVRAALPGVPAGDVRLLTGRMREPDAAAIRNRLLGRVEGDPGVRSGRQEAVRANPLVVVATQTLEVGADLDFDLLVTQSAGVRALTQRLGRLNRLGHRNAHARGVIVHVPGDDPVYGDEPDAVWAHLQSVVHEDSEVDLGPANVGTLGIPADDPGRAALLLPALLWEWAKTSLPPPGEAPIEPYYDGFDDGLARVSICWRAWVPPVGERLIPAPSQDEIVEVPIGEGRRLLQVLEDVRQHGAMRLTIDGTLEPVNSTGLRPGDTLLVGVDAGGYDPTDGWSVESRATVDDLSVLHRGVLPLRRELLDHLIAVTKAPTDDPWAEALRSLIADVHDDAVARTEGEVHQVVVTAVAQIAVLDPPKVVQLLLDRLHKGFRIVQAADATWVVMQLPTGRETEHVRLDAFDDLSFDLRLGTTSRALAVHSRLVGETAMNLGESIGIDLSLLPTLRLAGLWHDVGKTDPRFQRWLDPQGEASDLQAKGSGSRSWRRDQARSGWPVGARHELLSGRALQAHLAGEQVADVDEDLLVHLVQSHHGHGRPLIPTPRKDDNHAPFDVDLDGVTVTVSGDTATTDWTQPSRFRALCERYGYWGLALLETIVRQADHAASSVAGGEVELA